MTILHRNTAVPTISTSYHLRTEHFIDRAEMGLTYATDTVGR